MSVQANNIYVGARYIPRIMGEYNNETAYEALDIVTSGGVGYISRQPVPAGTAVTNKEYWAMWGSGNAVIDALTQRVSTNENNISSLETGLQQTNQNLQTTNQNLQTTNQNLQTTNQNLENLVIPWEPASTLKGDGSTDNTAAFGQLDANTPVSLMPGIYLISGNVTIPCAVQFLPGAVIKYNATTRGTNYVTITFAKGFYAPENTQIFDTYIIPKFGGNNATVNPRFSWFGGKESNSAQVNDNILSWLLSGTFLCREVTIEPGSYSFTDMSAGQYFTSVSTIRTKIRGYGAKITTQVKTAKVVYEGIEFSGGVETNENSIFENCSFTSLLTAGNNTTYTNCFFNNELYSPTGNFTINGGRFTVLNNTSIYSLGTGGKTCIKNLYMDLGGVTDPVSFPINNTIVLENIFFNSTAAEFKLDIGQSGNIVVSNCMCPNGVITANTAINNCCKKLNAVNSFGNIVNGKLETSKSIKSIIGYALTSAIGDAGLIKGVNYNVDLELVELYSDGSYKNLGAVNNGYVFIFGANKGASYNNTANTITLNAGETAQSVLVTFHSATPDEGTRGAFAFMVLRVNQAVG